MKRNDVRYREEERGTGLVGSVFVRFRFRFGKRFPINTNQKKNPTIFFVVIQPILGEWKIKTKKTNLFHKLYWYSVLHFAKFCWSGTKWKHSKLSYEKKLSCLFFCWKEHINYLLKFLLIGFLDYSINGQRTKNSKINFCCKRWKFLFSLSSARSSEQQPEP